MPETDTAFWREFIQVIVFVIVQPRSTRVAREVDLGSFRLKKSCYPPRAP
jgi:hypothetical protein